MLFKTFEMNIIQQIQVGNAKINTLLNTVQYLMTFNLSINDHDNDYTTKTEP